MIMRFNGLFHLDNCVLNFKPYVRQMKYFFNRPCCVAATWPTGQARGRLLRSDISWMITTGLKRQFRKEVKMIDPLLVVIAVDTLRTLRSR